MEWCRKASHGVTHCQDVVKGLLRKIAHANTEEELKEAVSNLKGSKPWKSSEMLQSYFTNTWEPHIKVLQKLYKSTLHHLSASPLDITQNRLTDGMCAVNTMKSEMCNKIKSI